MIAQESDAEFYDLPYYHTNIPGLASASDSYDTFDFEPPVARADYSDSDWGDIEEWTVTIDDAPQSSPKPSASSDQSPGLGMAPLPSLLHINKEVRAISSSMLEDTFRRTTRPSSLPCEDDGEAQGEAVVIVSPDPSFPHPHLLSTIIEEDGDEEPSSPERDSEDEDEMSDTETIRPSSSQLVADCQLTQESTSRPEC